MQAIASIIDSSKLDCEINGRDMRSLQDKCIKDVFVTIMGLFCFVFNGRKISLLAKDNEVREHIREKGGKLRD